MKQKKEKEKLTECTYLGGTWADWAENKLSGRGSTGWVGGDGFRRNHPYGLIAYVFFIILKLGKISPKSQLRKSKFMPYICICLGSTPYICRLLCQSQSRNPSSSCNRAEACLVQLPATGGGEGGGHQMCHKSNLEI